MLKIAVCDDEQNMLIKVKKIAGHFFRTHCVDCDIHVYENSDNLQYDLKDGVYYDLFLLDIEMPGVDGMALAKEISACLPAAKTYLLRLIWSMPLLLMNIQFSDIFQRI